MDDWFSFWIRAPLQPGLWLCAAGATQPRICSEGDQFYGSVLCSYVTAFPLPPLRLSLRGWLRPSLPLSLRVSISPESDQSPPQRRLQAWPFADIPTPLPGQNIKRVGAVLIAPSILSTSLALDSCAIASALAPQRLSISSATVIASVLATPTPQPVTGSALASQRFAVNRSWGSA